MLFAIVAKKELKSVKKRSTITTEKGGGMEWV